MFEPPSYIKAHVIFNFLKHSPDVESKIRFTVRASSYLIVQYLYYYVWFGKLRRTYFQNSYHTRIKLWHNSFNSIIFNRNWNYLTVSSSSVTMAWLVWYVILCYVMLWYDMLWLELMSPSLSLIHRPVVCFEGRGEIHVVLSLLLLFLTLEALFALDIFYTTITVA